MTEVTRPLNGRTGHEARAWMPARRRRATVALLVGGLAAVATGLLSYYGGSYGTRLGLRYGPAARSPD